MALTTAATILGSAAVIWNFAGDAIDAAPWATKEEMMRLAQDVIMLKRGETRRAILSNQQLRYDNLQEQRRWEEEGKLPPPEILQDAEDLEAERKRLRRELEELEQQ